MVFCEKLKLVKATARFGINFVVNADTISDLPSAADFAFDSGAEQLLLLPQTSTDGRITLSDRLMETLSAWIQANYQTYRLAISKHAIEFVDAPLLMAQNSKYESYEFMHVDALGHIRRTAFSTKGIALKPEDSILDCIKALRSSSLEMTS